VFGVGRWRVHLIGFDVFLVNQHHCTVLAQQRGKGQETGHGYHSGVHTLQRGERHPSAIAVQQAQDHRRHDEIEDAGD